MIVADTHVHTIMSGHAHSTLLEYLAEAKKKDHKFLFITDHTGILGLCRDDVAYFLCMKSTIPETHDGIHIIRGCEVNILDENATLDMRDDLLERSEWVIASLHIYLHKPVSVEQTTDIWLKVAENPHVDVIGHCGETCWMFDKEAVIKKFAECGKIVEVNSASIRKFAEFRENTREILLVCKKYGVRVVVSSDVHFAPLLGVVDESLELLREIEYPEELILNTDYERMAAVLSEKTGRRF